MDEMMKPTILIVDDSKTTRAMIKRVIGMMDLQVKSILEAENGAEGLTILAGAAVDVVLTDLNMPVMDGFEMVERMRGDARYQKIPVAIISAQPDQEKIEFLKHHGVAAYLSKPFTPEAIRNVVILLLAEQKPAEAPAAQEVPESFNMALVEALASAMETMAFISPELVSTHGILRLPDNMRIARVDFAGKDSKGSLALAATPEFMSVMVENLDAPDGEDALMELTNVTCGMLLRMRPGGGAGFQLTPPQVMSASEASKRAIFEKGDAVALQANGQMVAAQVVTDAAFFGEE